MSKKLISLLLGALMMVSVAGCSNMAETSSRKTKENAQVAEKTDDKDNKNDGKSTAGTCEDEGCVWDAYTPYSETITFTKGLQKSGGGENFPEGDSYENNDYTRYVKEQVNVQPKTAWEVDANNYKQKISLSIASKDIPDVMVVDRQVFNQLIENDLIWDMTEAYNKCISPFIKEQYDTFGDRLMKEVTRDGKIMGIPGTQLTGQHNLLWLRKDWLDKLGLEPPKTLEELENVAKAFIEKDPGGNGPGKTIGITTSENVTGYYNSQHGLYTVFSMFDAWPGQWVERDGKVVYGSTLPGMKDALVKLNEWYEAGILDKEFAVRKGVDREALVASGQLGIMFGPWWGWGGIPDSVKNNPEADWIPVAAPEDENGNINIYSQDPLNGILVVSKKFKHPEAIIKAHNASEDILRGNGAGEEAYYESIKTSPGMSWGVIPIPLQIGYEDSLKRNSEDLNNALEAKDPKVMKYKGFDFVYEAVMEDRANPKADISKWQEALIRTQGMAAATVANIKTEILPFYGTTETMIAKKANLEKLETEMMVKIIMGEKPIEEFDKFVEIWTKMGGDQITKEVQEAVNLTK